MTLFYNEALLWQQKWKRTENLGIDVLESLDSAEPEIYPSVNFYLKVLAVLPMSVASAERSFSTLNRLETYLRTTMTEDRLTGLCLMHTHRDIDVDFGAVIDRFASERGRRLNFIL